MKQFKLTVLLNDGRELAGTYDWLGAITRLGGMPFNQVARVSIEPAVAAVRE